MMLLKTLENTVLKKRPVQSNQLLDNEKFDLSIGSSLEIKSISRALDGHIKIILVHAIKEETTWYAFRRHVIIDGETNIAVQVTDTLMPVNSGRILSGATSLLGGIKPAYWGRYFSGVDYMGFGEYKRSLESNVLRNADIRVLPIGRFTTNVNRGQAEGKKDGQDQASDLLQTFGEDYLSNVGSQFYFFLDVEPSPALCSDYYIGWSDAVQKISSKVQILPCVYLNAGDSRSSSALNQAISKGAECHGLWMARYGNNANRPDMNPVTEFDSEKAKSATHIPCPVLFWQYAGDIAGDYDFSLSNPEVNQQELMSRLIPPKAI